VDKLKQWWNTRVQGDLATFFILLAGFDLTPYADDLADIFPHAQHIKPVIRIAGGVAIYWRATQARRTQAPAPVVQPPPPPP
jgi:hypothetical protein